MSQESENQPISAVLQPNPHTVAYDLENTLAAIVTVRTRVPGDAFTASILGTERSGHGVHIEPSGLFLTIGYVIAEADEIWLISANGQAVMGHTVGYDYETGFGLVQALGHLDAPALDFGDSDTLQRDDDVVVAGAGGRTQALMASIVDKREFAGYWEYVLDEAIFTAPAHHNWGGAAMLTADGKIGGIGSLYVENLAPEVNAGNMIVPINLLKPILSDLLKTGARSGVARPWLGFFVVETPEHLIVSGVLDNAPAARAGIRAGDVIVNVAGDTPVDLADFFRRIWACGHAGCDIPLALYRDGNAVNTTVHSIDRIEQFKSPKLH